MAVRIGHASLDERKKIKGGTAGDQTGGEVFTRTWYSKPWQFVLRPKSKTLAEKSAKACEDACANKNIGYDQNQRNTLYTQARKVNFDLSKISTPCECDCSSLMHVCALAGGANITYGSNGAATINMKSRFTSNGEYDVLTDKKYLTSDKYLKRGDILVKPGSHTVMALEDGLGAISKTETTKKSIDEIAKDVINGLYGNGDFRKKKLESEGYEYETVKTRVNEIIGKQKYYPKYNGNSQKVDDVLRAIGVSEIYVGNKTKRKPIGKENGFPNYTGKQNENLAIISLAKQGKLKKP